MIAGSVKTMSDEPNASEALDAAMQRLERAAAKVEVRLNALAGQAQAANGDLFHQDRDKLAADLDAARGRERELEAAGVQASLALGRAIATIRAALGDEAVDELAAEIGEDEPAPARDEA
jgi:hypothetical protein